MNINIELIKHTVQGVKGEVFTWLVFPMVRHQSLGPVPSFLEFTICILFSLLECFNRNEVRNLEGFIFFAFMAEDHITEARWQVVWHWFKACNRRVLRKSAASFLIPHLVHLTSRSSLLVQRSQWNHLCQSKTDLSHSIPKSPGRSLWTSFQLYIPLSHDVRANRCAVAGLSFIVSKQDMFNHLALKTPENGLENVLFRETINADWLEVEAVISYPPLPRLL